ncbi:MAG: CDP-alcohol phosphatidyltransferase family protein [Lachnospiraceae bacterium]|nr:CDP-alcohol phosphatidyltransferase family protein [Lachnospiraceae bacterium]
MIGFYNYTVIITYLSVVSAALGMYLCSQGDLKIGIFFFMFSGLCDMLDGPVSRTKKDRTDTERKFGIQIDSLCDCVSFGVQPAGIYYFIAKYQAPDAAVLHRIAFVLGVMLMLAAVIRLAFFNVSEEDRQKTEGTKLRKYYRGLPVTNVTWILPLFFLTRYFLSGMSFVIVMLASEALTAFLFLLDFKMPKVHGKKLIPVALAAIAVFVGVCLIKF